MTWTNAMDLCWRIRLFKPNMMIVSNVTAKVVNETDMSFLIKVVNTKNASPIPQKNNCKYVVNNTVHIDYGFSEHRTSLFVMENKALDPHHIPIKAYDFCCCWKFISTLIYTSSFHCVFTVSIHKLTLLSSP